MNGLVQKVRRAYCEVLAHLAYLGVVAYVKFYRPWRKKK